MKRFSIAMFFLSFWIAFILLGDPFTVRIIMFAIAGWFIGSWCTELADYVIKKYNI